MKEIGRQRRPSIVYGVCIMSSYFLNKLMYYGVKLG